jgi:alpha-tubulin suppressor-like RCC1 family protein
VGTEDDHAAPVQVSGLSGVISISAGGTFSCAVVDSGTAKCWGDNTWGVLGTGNTTSSLTPVQVSGLTGAASIVANGYTVCAIRDDGTAACWGSNGTGELGDGTQDDRYAPVNVLNLTGVTSIDGGGLHTCATDGSGIAWCWGHDSDGQVGNGEEYLYAATSPVQVVDLTGVVQITAAFTHSLAIDSSGRAWGWGYGGFGVLGNGVNGGPKPTSPIPTLEP